MTMPENARAKLSTALLDRSDRKVHKVVLQFFGVLCATLLAWALGVAAWGGETQLLPLMVAVNLALLGGLVAALRALTQARRALTEVQQAAMAEAKTAPDPLEPLFSKAFELSPLSMSLSRASDSVFLALNAASERMQGFRPDELLGRSALDLGTWQDAAERAAYVQKVRDHRGSGPLEMERQLRSKDGSLLTCRVWATLVEVNGESCLLCASLDITQQKQRETSLLDLAQGLASPVGEPFMRSAARFLAKALNADLMMVAELRADAQLATLALWKGNAQVANTSFDANCAPLANMLASTDLVWLDSPEGQCAAGALGIDLENDDVFQACAGLALRDAAGTPIGLLCAWWRTANGTSTTGEQSSLFRIVASRCTAELIRMQRDREIFQLKESLEHRVQARTEQLRATNAELESFAYSVSHDMQSPLRSIQGFLFLLERRLKPRLSDEENRLVSRINANVLRMHELINDLLALARVSRGNLVRETVDLAQIAEQLAADLQLASPQRCVHVSIAPDLYARCDAKLAHTVVENLLGNAWKYTRKASSAAIELGVLPAEPDKATTFFVRDNGAGFNMAYAGSLFKPFHRLHHEDEYEGSGIGLATVHRILERHGGNIWAEAVQDQGACFFFTFDDRQGASEEPA